MKNDNEFYDILKSKFDDQQVPFDEQNWKSMRQMIDNSRSDKKRVLWLVASLVVLLCVGGGIALYSSNNTKGNASNNYAATSTTTTTTTQTSKTVSTNAQESTPVGNKTINQTSEHANSVGQIGNTPSSANKPMAVNNSTGVNKTTSSSINGQLATHTSASSNVTLVTKRRIAKQNKGTNTIASNSNSGSRSLVTENTSIANGNVAAGSVQNATLSSSPASKGQSVAASSGSEKTAQTESKTASSVAKSNVHKADSAAPGDVIPQRFSDEPRVFMGKTNIFSVDAAIEYAGGWQIGSVVQGKGLNYTVGLGYEHYLGSRIFMKTGLQFSTFGNMSPLTYNYQHSVGNVIFDSVITTERLYFIKIPIQAEYFIGRRKTSSIGAGGSVWILLGNSGYATTYQQADNNPPVDIVRHTENASLAGYKEFDVSAHVFYRYVLSHKFSMYFILYQELTNMKDNSFFGENIIQRSKGVQYMLSYNLY